MSPSALCFRAVAGAILYALASSSVSGQSATTDPVGFYTLPATGGADNVLSVPLHRDAVFVGTIASFTANTLSVAAGAGSPGWTPNQFTYAAGTQPETYLAEVTSGNLRGTFYKITANGANALTLDTEGDDLTSHPLGALQANDSVRVRPYWRIRDIFEANGTPLIEARPAGFRAKDDIIIPSFGSGATQTPATIIHFFNGWKASRTVSTDVRDFPLQPNTSIILRRRNPNPLNLVNLGNVAMTRNVSYVPGGDGATPNATYLALAHAAPVTLDASGLYNPANPTASVIKPSTADQEGLRQDELLEFDNAAPGFNKAPSAIYYYKAGEGWKNTGGALVGATKLLEPGKGYVIRKLASNPGVDWVKDPNY
jgi:uncharacterized protein (TIGR02597 family)